MTETLTVIVELRPFGAASMPGIDELRRLLSLETLGAVGTVQTVRLALCPYTGVLDLQARRIHEARRRCARELYSLERHELEMEAAEERQRVIPLLAGATS